MKITEKVSFNIASKASYVYILSGQKFIKSVKNGQFGDIFENLKLAVKQCYQTETSLFKATFELSTMFERALVLGLQGLRGRQLKCANGSVKKS